MRALRNASYLKILLVLALSVIVTVMIAPNLSLVPARYQEGDIIPETITIRDTVALVDQKSTETRRQQALGDFPPIFDYDARLKQKTFESIGTAFQKMRDAQAGFTQVRADNVRKIRQISLDRIGVLNNLNEANGDYAKALQEKNNLLHGMGLLTDLANPNP